MEKPEHDLETLQSVYPFNKMENNILLNSLKTQLLISFSMLEKIIEICPDELMLTKADVIQLCNETTGTIEKWFNGKDDDWLKMPYAARLEIFGNIT